MNKLALFVTEENNFIKDRLIEEIQNNNKLGLIGAASNGADAIEILKQCQPRMILFTMNSEEQDNENPYHMSVDITKSIITTLDNLGVPASLTGYKYMTTALTKALENDALLESVTKSLYPEIAKVHNSTSSRVEKAIRHAIEVAWKNDPEGDGKAPFKTILRNGRKRPTNTEFLATVCKQLRLSSFL